MKPFARALVVAGALAFLPAVTHAHFKLLEPASWLIEDDLGDPQKAGPCGGSNADWGKPTFAVTQATGGSKLHIKVQETIYHPGFYRVALAVNSPPNSRRSEGDDRTDRTWTAIRVWRNHESRCRCRYWPTVCSMHRGTRQTPFETDMTLPEHQLQTCTLQVIQFMEQHGANNPGMYTYHHCATVQITADPQKPIDAAWPKER